MYDKYYNFSAMPFALTPDSRFFFGSKGHSRAFAHLTYGLAQAEGFIVVTGEVGAGKTTLVERLWTQLDRSTYTVARINTTQISSDDLFRLTIASFGLRADTNEKSYLLRIFEDFLRGERMAGRRVLLVVDEVQNLSLPALEELRMLSNMTEDGRASLQTILLGQPQFRSILASPDLDQLRQRVLASYHLGPLTEDETRAYIEHRLTAAGWQGNPAFRDDAFSEIHRQTDGIPRRINRLCSRVLLYGALEESGVLTRAMVENTARELTEDLETGIAAAPIVRAPNGLAMANGAATHGSAMPIATSAGGSGYNGFAVEADLRHRVSNLEEVVSRQERLFRKLLDVFGAPAGPRE